MKLRFQTRFTTSRAISPAATMPHPMATWMNAAMTASPCNPIHDDCDVTIGPRHRSGSATRLTATTRSFKVEQAKRGSG